MTAKPPVWRRDNPRTASAANIDKFPIFAKPTAAAFCPDGQPHHWLIDIPNGPTSRGICKKCGSMREHRNSLEQDIYGGDLGASREAHFESRQRAAELSAERARERRAS